MKFAWRNYIGDLAAWNSAQVEEVFDHKIKKIQNLLAADGEHWECDTAADKFVSYF
jgi:hypothetical protein